MRLASLAQAAAPASLRLPARDCAQDGGGSQGSLGAMVRAFQLRLVKEADQLVLIPP
ncbi:MAG: hypothetical protein U0805_13130 [Pirellulales bacterium]